MNILNLLTRRLQISLQVLDEYKQINLILFLLKSSEIRRFSYHFRGNGSYLIIQIGLILEAKFEYDFFFLSLVFAFLYFCILPFLFSLAKFSCVSLFSLVSSCVCC